MKVSREEARCERRDVSRESARTRRFAAQPFTWNVCHESNCHGNFQSISIDDFFCDYRLAIDWPLPIDINYLILSIDIDLLIAFPIIDFIDW